MPSQEHEVLEALFPILLYFYPKNINLLKSHDIFQHDLLFLTIQRNKLRPKLMVV